MEPQLPETPPAIQAWIVNGQNSQRVCENAVLDEERYGRSAKGGHHD